jgi:acyl-CoA hydrolase
MRRSRRTLALINRRTPYLKGSVSFPLSAFALAAEVDNPLKGYDVGAPAPASDGIARKLAPFIEDGDAIQIGLGKVPDALLGLIGDRRKLRLSSGMLADSAIRLAEGGALDPSFRHTSCVWVGSPDLYSRLGGHGEFTVAGCEDTHDLGRLMALDRFIAINSALSVDLFGQANLEHAEGKAVSGVGGAADFSAAARRSKGGLSIVAMPASFGRQNKSRIVARLGDGIASLPRDAIDLVVTDCGVADLRGLCVHERAEALIAIAAPDARSDLTGAWHAMRATL